ncbi:DNA polymerase III subunit delta' [Acidihalobacter ferrooxydans]|uniref:DNA polymerase III subunit delta' n=1 Tax=Acidihalobacter ferrooxydans TaxID=1765967 RepID=A0A1P8UIL7_9GAMM|nr:DNA polymerase III subunit delta' [Acidihalobacter ferrooxydans]APZ43644.1 DNA polymerase III subunit delta' [Acidihalobacter ferrooxydans]
MSVPYPWQQRQWSQLQAQREAGRVPHALLLTGIPGLGKRQLAEAFAQAALCERPREDGLACAQCHPCRLFAAGTHPDYTVVEPEAAGKAIRIDSARTLMDFLGLTRSFGAYKVALIDPADALNVNAANALLKTLEEPPAGTLLMLVTSAPSALPATVRSRCQVLAFGVPTAAQAQAWLATQPEAGPVDVALALAGGAPLGALQHADEERLARRDGWNAQLATGHFDPAVLGGEMAAADYAQALDVCLAWLRDVARAGACAEVRENPDRVKELRALGERVDLRGVFACLEQANRLRGLLGNGLNASLQLEELLLRYQAALRGRVSQ